LLFFHFLIFFPQKSKFRWGARMILSFLVGVLAGIAAVLWLFYKLLLTEGKDDYSFPRARIEFFRQRSDAQALRGAPKDDAEPAKEPGTLFCLLKKLSLGSGGILGGLALDLPSSIMIAIDGRTVWC
jgi:hypothetical protein